MQTVLTAHYLDPTDRNWNATIDTLWQQAGAAQNPAFIPPHFVKSTFPRMGGLVVAFYTGERLSGIGLLFPRAIINNNRHYTLRLHEIHERLADAAVQAALAKTPAIIYRPTDGTTFTPTAPRPAGVWIGPPQAGDLDAITTLYRKVWGSQPYPPDLFSREFGPGTALVATVDGQLAGFLLGFLRFGCSPTAKNELAIESQVLAVDPAYRQHGLATRLKQEQARLALASGLHCIHWTVDPLQLPNAILNFNHLHAVAGEFVRGYYPVRNEQNLVTASRFGITWLPTTLHGRQGLSDKRQRFQLSNLPNVAILNEGLRLRSVFADPLFIAIEIPSDWTALQHRDLNHAMAWRSTTDELFATWIGWDRYVIYAVAGDAGGHHYLVGRPAGAWIWEQEG
ncbi:MAG: GNAT family N-acetyltransferase [Chloroflexus sp.]|jgi:predicted GNAT superfamily acetyltransferase|nr:GNAT family N-acetyltransferase [Chloroflexus sp.]MBO9339784.1 GNAT family N-acetyltransferase [Chloroflexus sp.]MBO9347808.1 GNAT family N-acetyltransferase [Chloroflexus sp.]